MAEADWFCFQILFCACICSV